MQLCAHINNNLPKSKGSSEVVWLVDVDTPALLATPVTVWLPGVAAAVEEWSKPGAGGSSRAMSGWWPGGWLWQASKTVLTMVGMSAVVIMVWARLK